MLIFDVGKSGKEPRHRRGAGYATLQVKHLTDHLIGTQVITMLEATRAEYNVNHELLGLSNYAIGLGCDSVNATNMHIENARYAYTAYDNESFKPHVYQHCSFNSTWYSTGSAANDEFYNCILTAQPRPSGIVSPYEPFINRTVTYHNTAVNYDCSDCEGSIRIPTPSVDSIPVDLSLDDFTLDDYFTPSRHSVIADQGVFLSAAGLDILGRPRDPNGPVDLGAFEQERSLSLPNPQDEITISITPNPTIDRFTVHGLQADQEIEVYNSQGKKVQTAVESSFTKAEVQLAATTAAGLYHVVVSSADGTQQTLPLMVVK